MPDVATVEPRELRAGDTWAWRIERLRADYPASLWQLRYEFKNADEAFEILATADGDDFAVAVTPTVSATRVGGLYRWVAFVQQTETTGTPPDEVTTVTARHTVGTGPVLILANYDDDDALDGRSFWRRVYDNVSAVLEGRASKDQQSYTINGRSLNRMPLEELRMLYEWAKREVDAEQIAEDIANGRGGARRLLARL